MTIILTSSLLLFIIPLATSNNVDTSTTFQTPENITISLGILLPTFDDLPTPNRVNLTVIVSNCTTTTETTCVPLIGADVQANVTPPNATNYTIIFDDQGDGNYTNAFLFNKVIGFLSNFTFNITANHSDIGSTSLLRIVSVSSSVVSTPNLTSEENVTTVNGSVVSEIGLVYPSNATIQINVTVIGGANTFSVNLPFIANKTREMASVEGCAVISPATASVNISSVNKAANTTIGFLNETASLYFGKEQEVVTIMNNSVITINLSVFENEPRYVGLVCNETLITSPRNATLTSLSYSTARRGLSFSATGTSTQEIFLYVGDKGEPDNITADSTVLTSANWTFNSTEKTLVFNYSFSTVEFLVSWPPPALPTPPPEEPAPSAPGPGGGGAAPAPEEEEEALPPFTVAPNIFQLQLTVGGFTREFLTIENGPETREFFIENQMEDFVVIEENIFTLEPNAVKNIFLIFFAPDDREPDTYIGNILVTADDATINIPIIIDVRPSVALLDASVRIREEYKTVTPGSKILAEIELINLGTTPKLVDVNIKLEVVSIDNAARHVLAEETLAFQTQISFVRDWQLPEDLVPGKYVLILTVDLEGQKVTASDTFDVRERELDRTFLYLLVIGFIALGVIMLAIFFEIHRHHHREERPRKYRYHLRRRIRKRIRRPHLRRYIRGKLPRRSRFTLQRRRRGKRR